MNSRKRSRWIVLWHSLSFAVLSPTVVAGQYAADLSTASFEELEIRGWEASRESVRAPDHRNEGAVIGGLVFGVGGAALVGGLCSSSDDSDNCGAAALKGGILLGALGALAGALIGGLFPKDGGELRNEPEKPPADNGGLASARAATGRSAPQRFHLRPRQPGGSRRIPRVIGCRARWDWEYRFQTRGLHQPPAGARCRPA